MSTSKLDQLVFHSWVLSDDQIDWTVGDYWGGLAGNARPSTGRFAVGNTI